MTPGVHLRWNIGGDLGFPSGGFEIFRRDAQEINWYCLDIVHDLDFTSPRQEYETSGAWKFIASASMVYQSGDCPAGGGLYLEGQQTLQVIPPLKVRAIQVVVMTKDSGVSVSVRVVSDKVVIAKRSEISDASRTVSMTIQADPADRIVVEGTDFTLCRLCVAQSETFLREIDSAEWTRLNAPNTIYLPVTVAGWPGTHPHAPDDQAEAEARLPSGLSTTAFTRYATGFADDLEGLLETLVLTHPQGAATVNEAGTLATETRSVREPPSLRLSYLDLLGLAAIDPNIARILGLYWVDVTADSDKRYDYLVVGAWRDTPYPGHSTTFEELTVDSEITRPLTQDGMAIAAPRLVTVRDTKWQPTGDPERALEISDSAYSDSIWILLEGPSPSVDIRFRTDTGVTVDVAAFSGSTLVVEESHAGGSGTLRIEPDGTIDRLRLNVDGVLWLFEIVTRPIAGAVGDLGYIVYDQGANAGPSVLTPALLAPVSLHSPAPLRSDSTLSDRPNATGLRWQHASDEDGFFPAQAPVLFLVRRTDLGAGDEPETSGETSVLNGDRPTLPVDRGTSFKRPRPFGWPTSPLDYLDRGLEDGWYQYEVCGIDVFGRVSEWSDPQTLQLLDVLGPPPPIEVNARYVDPADPWLSAAESAWAAKFGCGVHLTWLWPGIRRLQAPDVEAHPSSEFRVYGTRGSLNALTGRIVSVSGSGDRSVLVTDQAWSGSANALAGLSVRIGSAVFPVLENTSGESFSITVRNLVNPTELPSAGSFTISFPKTNSNWIDYRVPVAWQERLLVRAVGEIPMARGTIGSVSASASVYTVTTDQSFDEDATLAPGVLVCEGTVYKVAAHSLGATLEVDVRPRVGPTTDMLPTVGASFAYYPGRRYEAWISTFVLAPESGQDLAVGNLAVTTSDGRQSADDDPRWSEDGRGGLGSRPGNEGAACPPCRMVAPRRTRLSAPAAAAAGNEHLYASPADYYGQARFTLSWDAVPGSAGYVVYRCSKAALYANDMSVRGRDASYYENLTDAEIQALASEVFDGKDYNQGTFSRVNADPITATSYTDSFDGRGSGFYVHRIRAVDASGNLGEWGGALPPVYIRDVTPPQTPVLVSALGGERSVTLVWRANSEADLAEYRLWRAMTAEDLEDVRRIAPLVAAVPGESHEETYVDSGLIGATTYHYRIAAVDSQGNLSEPSTTTSARAVDTVAPTPPDFSTFEWADTAGVLGIHLGWEPPEGGSYVLIERRPATESEWSGISGWMPSSTTSFDDTSALPFVTYVYRIKIRSSAGLLNTIFHETTVKAFYCPQ